MNLTGWARAQDVHPQTASRWFREGSLPVPAVRIKSRHVLVAPDAASGDAAMSLGHCAGVSSHDQRADLYRRVAELSEWAAKTGPAVARIEGGVGSGMNGPRSQPRRMLADPRVTTVVVEHSDRLARMNAELVEAALTAQGRRWVVVDDGEMDDDLVGDMVEALTWFCVRVYGRRSARNRAEKALRCAAHNLGPRALSQPDRTISR